MLSTLVTDGDDVSEHDLPSDWLGFSLKYDDPPLIGIQDLKEHKRVRRPWNRGMTPSALKEYDILMETRAIELIRSLESRCGQVVVMQKLFGPFM